MRVDTIQDTDLTPRKFGLPWPGAAIDLDFKRRKYWWGGAEKLEANFTTFVLGSATFGPQGLQLVSGGGTDITLALAGLGTFVPGAAALAVLNTGTPAAGRPWADLSDATMNERVTFLQGADRNFSLSVVDGGVTQASGAANGIATNALLNIRHGLAASYDTNSFLIAANTIVGNSDLAGTLPTVTSLRIGRYGGTAGTEPSGILARVLLFTAVKTQAELNALSGLIRDN